MHLRYLYLVCDVQNSYLPTIPEDNFLKCIDVIAQTMQGTGYNGQWYGECFMKEKVLRILKRLPKFLNIRLFYNVSKLSCLYIGCRVAVNAVRGWKPGVY